MLNSRDKVLRSLRFAMAACIVAPIALFAYASYVSYNAAFALVDERINRSLEIVFAYSSDVLQEVFAAKQAIENGTFGALHAQDQSGLAAPSARLEEVLIASPTIRSIRLLDDTANVVATASPINGVTFEARPQPTGSMEPQIGEINLENITSVERFPIWFSRRGSGGERTGWIELSLSPSTFESFFSRVGYTPNDSFALLREDGAILARYPLPATTGIKLDPGSGFRRTIAARPEGGYYTTVSGVDQIERRFAIKKLRGYPLYVSSSLVLSDVRNAWLKQMTSHLIFGLPATIVLVALLYFAIIQTKALYEQAAKRERAEATLRQSLKMEAIGQLTGGIAHDFNNLLTVIMGNLQIARRQNLDDKLRRQVENAFSSAQRAAQLTKRLLAFSRNQPLQPQPVAPDRLIAGMSDLLHRTLGETIAIETVQSAGLWQIEIDPVELESAILNLAINARDAMPEGGKLTIETANTFLDERYCASQDGLKPGQYVQVAVSDTGTGMSPETLSKAFDPFFTTKPAGVGTGLGLSQVYGFVKQSQGHIQIYSELGEGTTIRIYLPRFHGVSHEPRETPAAILSEGRGERILVVEDDNDVRAFIVETLTELGYRVTDAARPSEALAYLAGGSEVDLLLTDVVMPEMNGRVLAGKASETRPGLKVLFMTGYSRNAIVHHGRLDPGVLLIQKPFSQQALAERVRSALDDMAQTGTHNRSIAG